MQLLLKKTILSKKEYKVKTYREFLDINRENILREEARKLCTYFGAEVGYLVSEDYILEVLKKLNNELITFPIDLLKKEMSSNLETIELIKYKYKATTSSEIFEENLYHLIEDNLNGRYKHRLVERLSGLYTMIGNKFKYTNIMGETINRHTIADFNKNANAAIVKKETFLTNEIMTQLNDKKIEKNSMNALPVPVIEVVFYFPKKEDISNEVEMYNGNDVKYVFDFINKQEKELNKEPESNKINQEIYEEVEKELQWEEIYENQHMKSEKNIEKTKIKHEENFKEILEEKLVEPIYEVQKQSVRIQYVDEVGNELKTRKIELVQIGTEFNPDPPKTIKDKKGNEWKLVEKEYLPILVTENEKENVINYMYEVAKARVIIKHLKLNGEELKPEEHLLKQVGSGMVPTPEAIVYDRENLCWKLSKIHPAMLKVANEDNVITIMYEEAKGRVTLRFLDIAGNRLKEDEIQRIQIGIKYTPIVTERVIYKSEEVWKLMEIKPYEIVISENESENVIELIYSNAK